MSSSDLQGLPPHLLAERIAAEATQVADAPVGLYLIDLSGARLMRMAGPPDLPERLAAPQGIGPEVPPESFPELVRCVQRQLPGAAVTPMQLYGRAVAVLVAARPPAVSLQEFADTAALVMEHASDYTDRFQMARRDRPITAAAEIQQNLLPPRLAVPDGAELAASILPAYAVGGDWFEHAENGDGLWLAVADGVGKGDRAAALAALALGAFRAARRNGEDLSGAAAAVHAALLNMPDLDFVTAVLGRWRAPYFHWINCGHPHPIVVSIDGRAEELRDAGHMPLGLSFGDDRSFTAHRRRIEPGERLVLYSDGVSERRRPDGGLFGAEGILAALRGAPGSSAVASVSAVLAAIRGVTSDELRDDATVLVLRRIR